MKKIYAIQRLDNGQVFDYCKTREVVVNGEDKSEWFLSQVDKMKGLYV